MNTEKRSRFVQSEGGKVKQVFSSQERRKLDLLLSLQLVETVQPTRSLRELMQEASEEAQSHGLTPEILAEILDEQ